MNTVTIMLIIKLLDFIHDLLCPFFCDNTKKQIKAEDLSKIIQKLDKIESLLYKDKN